MVAQTTTEAYVYKGMRPIARYLSLFPFILLYYVYQQALPAY